MPVRVFGDEIDVDVVELWLDFSGGSNRRAAELQDGGAGLCDDLHEEERCDAFDHTDQQQDTCKNKRARKKK
jgi:hypothetical protein